MHQAVQEERNQKNPGRPIFASQRNLTSCGEGGRRLVLSCSIKWASVVRNSMTSACTHRALHRS